MKQIKRNFFGRWESDFEYNSLTNHFKPDSNYIFPVKFLHGSDRSLTFHWLIKYPFCKNNKNKLARRPGFSKWHKVGDKLKIHVNNGTHSAVMTVASGYKEKFEKPSLTLTCGYEKHIIKRVQDNHKIWSGL